MTVSRYLTIQQIIMAIIFALGCHLIFEYIPKGLKGSRIDISGRLIGAAMTVIPTASFIYFFSDLKNAGAQYATAINLSAYCYTLTLIAMAYYILLEKANDKPLIITHITLGILYPLPLWLGLCYGSEIITKQIIVISYTIFCVLGIIHISTCLYFYKERVKRFRTKM